MVNQPKISIIIPLWVVEKRFFRDLLKFDRLNYSNAEILIVSDKFVNLPKLRRFKTELILTGKNKTGPAEKRDIAIKKAKGDICAFIDDDAYPDKNWLQNAIVHFNHPKIAAVGGPGLTPSEDNYWEQMTGLVYSSFFCGGHARHRFVKENIKFVNDFPAYNLLVRTNVLKDVGGYDTHFYGGEDTFLCLKIIRKGYKIIYDPEVVVYHHRRQLFIPYLRQIANIGIHRGYFAKKYPETSRTFTYFLPSLLTLGLIIGFGVSLFSQTLMTVFLSTLSLFMLLSYFSVLKKGGLINSFIVSLGIILTHITYGLYFIIGLLTKDLKR